MSPESGVASQLSVEKESRLRSGLRRSLSKDGMVYLVLLNLNQKDGAETEVGAFITKPVMSDTKSPLAYISLHIPYSSIYNRELGIRNNQKRKGAIYQICFKVINTLTEPVHDQKTVRHFLFGEYGASSKREHGWDMSGEVYSGGMSTEAPVVEFINGLETQFGLKIEPLRKDPS